MNIWYVRPKMLCQFLAAHMNPIWCDMSQIHRHLIVSPKYGSSPWRNSFFRAKSAVKAQWSSEYALCYEYQSPSLDNRKLSFASHLVKEKLPITVAWHSWHNPSFWESAATFSTEGSDPRPIVSARLFRIGPIRDISVLYRCPSAI
jgi:hypothetical protein